MDQIDSSNTQTPPHPDAATPPRIELVGSVPTRFVAETFNAGFDAKDPAEFLGAHLDGFTSNFTMDLPAAAQEHVHELVPAIYDCVERKVRNGHLAATVPVIVNYRDAKVPREGARRFIRFERRTIRDTLITTLFRCTNYGPANLYIALDSYRLGKIAVRPVLMRFFLTLFVYITTLMTLALPLLLLPMVLVSVAVTWWYWGPTVRAARSRGFVDGLRTTYPARLKASSFDYDDTMMHLRSLLPAVMDAIKEVGPNYGMELTDVEDILQKMSDKMRGQTINIDNRGTMSGVNVGGESNKAYGSGT